MAETSTHFFFWDNLLYQKIQFTKRIFPLCHNSLYHLFFLNAKCLLALFIALLRLWIYIKVLLCLTYQNNYMIIILIIIIHMLQGEQCSAAILLHSYNRHLV